MDTACHFTGCIEAGDRLAVLIQDLSIVRNLQTTHGVMDRRCTRSSIERRFNDRTIKEFASELRIVLSFNHLIEFSHRCFELISRHTELFSQIS